MKEQLKVALEGIAGDNGDAAVTAAEQIKSLPRTVEGCRYFSLVFTLDKGRRHGIRYEYTCLLIPVLNNRDVL